MSEYGVHQPAPGPPPPEEEKSSDEPAEIPMWAIGGLGVVALALIVLLGVMIVRPGKEPEPIGPLPTSKPTHPPKWDKRIAPIAKQVAALRGLSFSYPVKVRFLSDKAFAQSIRDQREQLTKADEIRIEHTTETLRALGLLSGDVDLQELAEGNDGGSVLAYYTFADERVTVRGKKITPSVRATLVHELTHVLQDQNFQVGDRILALTEKAQEKEDSTAAAVLRAVVEGDAERVRYLYQETLDDRERRALRASQQRELDAAQARVGQDVPQLLVTQSSAPYTLGLGLAQALAAYGGNGAVDNLFEESPAHDAVLFDPFRAVLRQTGATKVAVPALEDGEEEFHSGEVGALTWYFMLAERLPLPDALDAVGGWGGDAYVGFERDGSTCVRMAFAGRTPRDTARMGDALDRWAAASPGEQTVDAARKTVTVASCDPGTGATVGADASIEAMSLVATRTAVVVTLVRMGLRLPVARCVASGLVHQFSVAQLNDPAFAQQPAVQAQISTIGSSCRSA